MSEAKTERTITGRVISDRMDKTITVAIERRLMHPLYGKTVRRTTKVRAHDENNECRTGDKVVLTQCRPMSKSKRWKLVRIAESASAEQA